MNKCMNNFLVVALVLLVPCLAFALPGAHDPTSGRGYTCNSCHTSGQSVGHTDLKYATNVCFRCHTNGGAVGNKAKSRFQTEDFANPFGTTTVVQTTKIQSSHKWFGSDNRPAAGAQAPVDTAINGLNKSANFLGNLFCARCHNVHGTSGAQSNNSPYLRYPNDQDQLCRNCHAPRDTTDHKLGTHPVNVNYSAANAARPTLFLKNPITNAVNPTGQVKLINGKVLCSTCHGVHNTDSRTSTFDRYTAFGQLSSSKGYLLRVDAYGKTADDVNICTNCHAGRKNHNLGSKNGTKSVQCNDCHSGHVEYDAAASGDELIKNKYLVRRYLQYTTAGRVNKRIFYRYTGSSTKEFYNASKKGVCQSCHNPPSNHYVGNIISGAFPEPGHLNCNSCHKHGTTSGSFSYDTGSCATNTCHGLPPVTNVVGAGGKAAGYTTFDEGTTPHMSHAAGGGSNDFDCYQCHKGAGSVMPLTNGNYVEVFKNHTGILAGASATYTGSNCNNVYCHSNGRGIWKAGMNPIAWGNNKRGTIIGQTAPLHECNFCHDDPNASQSHLRHISVPTAGMGYGCVTCHAATVSDNTTLLSAAKVPGGTHTNAVKDVQFSQVSPAVGSSCATVYCHSNGKGAAPITVPVWGTASTGTCGKCHKTKAFGNLSTGGHKITAHISTDADCVKCHTYNGETVAPHVNGNLISDIKTGVTGCAANACHGTITAPTWTVSYAGKDTCTKCHGTLATTAELAIDRSKMAPSIPAGTDAGIVSADPKTGAHQTHLRYLNGFSNYSTIDYRCQSCHGTPLPVSGSHANGTSTPQGAFRNIATKWGAMTGQTYIGTTCANTYCHNPAGAGGTLANAGSDPSPDWNEPTYIDNSGKTQANCGKCHKVPGDALFTKQAAHGANVTNAGYVCTGCHGHNGDTTGPLGQRHMDGRFYANGACDSCHGYPPLTQPQLDARGGTYVDARLQDYAGGSGYHTTHLLTTVVQAEGFTPCLPCHPSGYHQQGGSTVTRGNIQVNDAADTGYRFDNARSKRYNSADWKCSNVSCHFRPSPAWNQ